MPALRADEGHRLGHLGAGLVGESFVKAMEGKGTYIELLGREVTIGYLSAAEPRLTDAVATARSRIGATIGWVELSWS